MRCLNGVANVLIVLLINVLENRLEDLLKCFFFFEIMPNTLGAICDESVKGPKTYLRFNNDIINLLRKKVFFL